jgi:hypothetical protein
VGLHSLGAQAKPASNLFGRVSFGDETKNFALSQGEYLERRDRFGRS